VVKDRSFKRRKVCPSRGTTKFGGDEDGGWATTQGGVTQLRKKLGPKRSGWEKEKGSEVAEEFARRRSLRCRGIVYCDASGRKIRMGAEKAEATRWKLGRRRRRR